MKNCVLILVGLAAIVSAAEVRGILCSDKATIKRTWSIVNDLPSFGRNVFLSVFAAKPEYKNLFVEFRNIPASELANSERLLYHGGRVLASIDEVISEIDSPDSAAKKLVALGERHITRGTVRRHFEAFSYAFIDELKQRGVASADLAAWRKGWDSIVDILEAGLLKRQIDLEVTGLSCVDVANVQESWATVSANLKNTGSILFQRLINDHPEYQQLFRQFRDVELAKLGESNGFVAHVFRVVAAFDGIIKELDNNPFIVSTLKRLGEQHIARGTDISHFQNFRTTLLVYLNENGMNQAQEASWNKAFDAIEKYISIGLKSLERVDPITGLSGLEKNAILNTWGKVRGNLQEVGKATFGKLFAAHPEYQQMFRFFQGVQLAELVESPKFAAHTQRVVSALDQTLLALNRPSDFVYMIKELGLDHINRGTDRSHFENYQVVFVEYLQETLGDSVDEFTVKSFNHVFEVIINFLNEGLRQANVVDPVTHLTGRQKEAIKASWSVARTDLRFLGQELFMRMFNVHPEYQSLFVNKGFADVPLVSLREDERFISHMANVLRGFDTLLQNLDDTSYFVYALRNLGDAHIQRKAGTEHFRSFEAILIPYLQESQGLDAAGVEAWKKFFDVSIGVIAQGLKVASSEEADPVTGLYGKEVVALRQAFAAIAPRNVEIGKRVFAKLFTSHPEYKNLFKKFEQYSVEELPSTDAFDYHISLVMNRFSAVGKVIDDNVSFVYLLKKLGREHIKRGLSRKQFDQFVELYIAEISPELSETGRSGLEKVLTFATGVIEQGLFQLGQVDSKALTALEKQSIQDIWTSLRATGLEELAVKMFTRLFADHPEYKLLFTGRFGNVDNINENAPFRAHLHRVLSAFDIVITSLDNNALLIRQLKDLGLFHTRLGMTRAHFDNFATAFFSVAEDIVPNLLTALGRESLGKGFKLMVAVIEEGLLQLERIDPITGLSVREVEVVKQTWNLVKPDLMGVGMRIFKSLFEKFPAYQAVFPKFSDVPLDKLEDIPAVGKHAISVTTKLDELIQTLDEPANLALLARQLGEDHIVLGVNKPMFKSFGEVLVRLLENDLGQRFSNFASKSWHRAYDVIVEYIEEGLQQSYKQDPVTGITDAEKVLVQRSWELLKPDLLGLGRKIFGVIFTKHPEYQILFTRVGFGDTPLTQLDNNPAFGEHIIKVMRAFDYVIRNLGKPKTLLAYLKNVGADHIARNVERRHFQAFSEALIPVMQRELKAQLKPEAVAAWRKGLDRIIGVIDQGLLGLKEVNPQIAFSAADIEAIQKTWALAKPDLMGKGATVFRQLFTDHGYQPLFSNLVEYEVTGLEGSPELNTHARNVMAQLDTLVGSLQNSIELGKSLNQLGKDHVPRKVNKVHFDDFAEHFVPLMKANLGDEFTPLAESAWKKAFNVMVATIEQGQRARRSIATFLTNPVA
ncbi:uncharacterized protein LOC136043866 [Artemia franciscana]|uniref:Globin domain-containing protein n=1 Tax=Artemia franciscana TaxID=6661 RepID=A0AA88HP52_ARTSF|nr:hypothetical protein QYM36_010137 [Artemia franciscana]